ncbi:hypothetical protein NBEOAGPD_1728 [Methylobacterium gregans]|uniref:Uncharacterized protein n=1 Tax=Methylobacterium gregans TaxID=374424 RepID=A0AA37MAH7_9HYPH|nr:hypothetical protein NBEOAGPD_1728 [Methylobacterium gregans]
MVILDQTERRLTLSPLANLEPGWESWRPSQRLKILSRPLILRLFSDPPGPTAPSRSTREVHSPGRQEFLPCPAPTSAVADKRSFFAVSSPTTCASGSVSMRSCAPSATPRPARPGGWRNACGMGQRPCSPSSVSTGRSHAPISPASPSNISKRRPSRTIRWSAKSGGIPSPRIFEPRTTLPPEPRQETKPIQKKARTWSSMTRPLGFSSMKVAWTVSSATARSTTSPPFAARPRNSR